MNAPVDTRLIQQLDSAHFLHPFTDFKDLATRGARVITRADGIYAGAGLGWRRPRGGAMGVRHQGGPQARQRKLVA